MPSRRRQKVNSKAAFYTGKYRNVFAEAGYSKKRSTRNWIRCIVTFSKDRIKFILVGDSMAMFRIRTMIPVPKVFRMVWWWRYSWTKRMFFDRIWRWSKIPATSERSPRRLFAWSYDPVKQDKTLPVRLPMVNFITSPVCCLASNRWVTIQA